MTGRAEAAAWGHSSPPTFSDLTADAAEDLSRVTHPRGSLGGGRAPPRREGPGQQVPLLSQLWPTLAEAPPGPGGGQPTGCLPDLGAGVCKPARSSWPGSKFTLSSPQLPRTPSPTVDAPKLLPRMTPGGGRERISRKRLQSLALESE